MKKNNNKVIKMKNSIDSKNLIHLKKLKILLISVILIFIILIIRIGSIQFVEGSSLKEMAYKQQTINQIISPKRGNIYDCNGKALGIGAQVDTITINPTKIVKDNDTDTKSYKEQVAHGLSDIFELDYNEVLQKVNNETQVETIIKKVEQEKVDELKKWMKDNKITVGINIDEDTKRYYPYGTVASNVIGFCGSDNQGLSGIEATWESFLTGTPGKIVSSKGNNQQEIPNAEETYISAENGSDLVLTLDLNIQTIVEKYLKQAVENNNCSRGGNAIAMNPKTGDIYAMASYPDYDLNAPYTPNAVLAQTYSSLSSEEKSEALYKMWSNKSVAETYEPGSTFKIITTSVALEENITSTDIANDFYCNGSETFSDVVIKCWSSAAHGPESLRLALMNSCNPAFMQLGKRIGAETLYKYYNAFGFFNTTNSGLYGEQSGVFHKLENVNDVELATMSFGQRINITPLQLITAVSSIANDGILMKPRIVKEIINTDTSTVTEVPVTQVRQVVSKQTAESVRNLMESVTAEGTGKNGAVTGYTVGGKTGTSEPPVGKKEEGYVASYIAISPVEDSQIVLLVTLYDPEGKNGYQGGQIAGPVVSQMLSEILPYLGVPSDQDASSNTNSDNNIIVPDIRQRTVSEADKILKNAGFNTKIYVDGDPNTILVENQTPKPGNSLSKDSIIVLYGQGSNVSTSVAVPDLEGLNASQATSALKAKNLNINIEGSGLVISQDYSKDEQVQEGTIIKVTLKPVLANAH